MAKTKSSQQDKPQQHTGGQHPEEYRRDLNPDAGAGQNVGGNRTLVGAHDEKNARTAYDLKDLHARFESWPDDELKLIRVLPVGAQLEQGATYVDLNGDGREFTARGDQEAGPNNYYVAKDSVPYQTWNKLIGVDEPARLGVAGRDAKRS